RKIPGFLRKQAQAFLRHQWEGGGRERRGEEAEGRTVSGGGGLGPTSVGKGDFGGKGRGWEGLGEGGGIMYMTVLIGPCGMNGNGKEGGWRRRGKRLYRQRRKTV
ncbi:hypothetical protein Naga_100151g13, partial [Nannochloropsis gaditana]